MSNKVFATAVLIVAAFHINSNSRNLGVDALPSFGQKIPNGEKVPCPASTSPGANGCTASGFCFGLGHLDCGGFKQDDRIVTVATNEDTTSTSTVLLNPFGDDWRSNGFVWTKDLCRMDSDGDGFTNGEELGDPCCVWTIGSGPPGLNALSSTSSGDATSTGFVPSHPGLKDEIPPQGFVLDKADFCAGVFVEEEGNDTDNDNDNDSIENVDTDLDTNYTTSAYDVSPSAYDSRYDQYFNTNEERGAFEFRIQPYPIPIKTTTYVDFIFNLPEDLPDFVHVVFAEAIISQPDHLHHFVLNGCAEPVKANQEGVPMEDISLRDLCMITLGSWSPGMDILGSPPLDTGVLIGRGMGVAALRLNIHYTDGAYEDDASKLHRMATEGMKILYMKDFRPNTSLSKTILWAPYGPRAMAVPPGTSRYFLSRTCSVNTSCRDVQDEQLAMMTVVMGSGGNAGPALSCAVAAPFCFMGNEMSGYVQQLCPVTCGLCDENDSDNGISNYRNPDGYRVTGITYHAHSLGSEMYATLLREQEAGLDAAGAVPASIPVVQKKQQQAVMLNETFTAKDLKSREIWHFNDQASIPMDYDVFTVANSDIGNSENSNTASTATTELKQGVYVKPGDKLQVTCVYDSTARAEATSFGASSHQEMCTVTVHVSFPTPPAIMGALDAEGANKIQTAVDLKLRNFQCGVDNEFHTSDIYQGFLEQGEDGRNIWSEHPIQDAQLCTFPVDDFEAPLGASFLNMQTRNCPVSEKDKISLCQGYKSEVFFPDTVAGFKCYGGTFDQKDSNKEFDNISSSKCLLEGGGDDYQSYSCLDAHDWMFQQEFSPDEKDYMYSVWQPLCCGTSVEDGKKIMCHGYGSDKSVFLPDTVAGFMCYGGKFDQQSSNKEFDNVSSKKCLLEGGGDDYKSYSCLDAHNYMLQQEFSPAEKEDMDSVWQPLCCSVVDGDGVEQVEEAELDGDGVEQVEEAEGLSSSSSSWVFSELSALGLFLALLAGIAY